jgi:hypothetical protein
LLYTARIYTSHLGAEELAVSNFSWAKSEEYEAKIEEKATKYRLH